MVQAALNEIAFDSNILRRHLPFKLRGESRIGPACIGISLEVAHMTDWLVFIDLTEPTERHYPPLIVLLFPIQRCLPLSGLYCIPSLREPQQRILIAAILHKFQILAISY